MHIILASASPRRKELLGQLVEEFSIIIPDIDENSKCKRPHKRVMDIAKRKAETVQIGNDELVIAADTTVYMDGNYYDKPLNAERAKKMLVALNGKTHNVYSGVCIKTAAKTVTFYEKSSVTFKFLEEAAIDGYITGKKPFDKAGAYGIQDKLLVKSYKGSYTNIVGLPIERLRTELMSLGFLFGE